MQHRFNESLTDCTASHLSVHTAGFDCSADCKRSYGGQRSGPKRCICTQAPTVTATSRDTRVEVRREVDLGGFLSLSQVCQSVFTP